VDSLEYCSSRFWRVNEEERVMGPKLGRLLAKAFMPHRIMRERDLYEHVRTVARGFYHYRWIPGLDVLLDKLGVTGYSGATVDLQFKSMLVEPIEVDPAYVEEYFMTTYGFRGDQLRALINSIDFDQLRTTGFSVSHVLFDRLLEIDGIDKGDFVSQDLMPTREGWTS